MFYWRYADLVDRLERIETLCLRILRKEREMAGELDALRAQVASNTTVIGSAVDLIQGLKQKLDDAIASGDPAALTALSAELATQDERLAAAVAANTPAAPSAPGTPGTQP